MTDTIYTPRFWVLSGLPGQPETASQDYTFDIGHLDFAAERDALYLHISEISHRDAEGRSRYPEQETWTNRLLAEHAIAARQIWFSQWQFAGLEEALAFEKILWKAGAFREWHLSLVSTVPGVLLEKFAFILTPCEDGTLCLQICSDPPGQEFQNRQAALVNQALARHQVTALETAPHTWQFSGPATAWAFEDGLKSLHAVHRGESFFY